MGRDPENRRKWQRAHYVEHKEEILEKQRARYAARMEKIRLHQPPKMQRTEAERRERRKVLAHEQYLRSGRHMKNAARISAKNKKRYQEKRDEIRAYQREKNVAFRKSVLEHYGGKCACCGETEYKFLSIDHINGDGAKHRREIGKGGTTLYRWLVKNKFPPGFQVLCHNCNFAKGIYGMCPHNERRDS